MSERYETCLAFRLGKWILRSDRVRVICVRARVYVSVVASTWDRLRTDAATAGFVVEVGHRVGRRAR